MPQLSPLNFTKAAAARTPADAPARILQGAHGLGGQDVAHGVQGARVVRQAEQALGGAGGSVGMIKNKVKKCIIGGHNRGMIK